MTDAEWERVASDYRCGVEVLCIGTSGKPMGFAIAAPVRRRQRRRRYSLSAALRQAHKAALPVGGAEFKPDGSIALRFGEVGSTNVEHNEWDDVR